ncbi:hypothetical protein HORIV_35820 [Vreelandella olivaria]|uniref:Uncharacterized protein n=1 Tax=Vreelandella olivaria TaxID=390919 RepID=A0ABN5WW36_9GAMM|nr:hypothetical protein HORIV_35820 [Halomonas olivaria]
MSLEDVATLAEELEAAGVTYEVGIYSGAPMPSAYLAAMHTMNAPMNALGQHSMPGWLKCFKYK